MPTVLKLTHDAMRKCFPGAPEAIINAFVEKQGELAKAGILDTPERLAYCFANLSAEVDGFRLASLTENINYSHRRVAEVWPNRFSSAESVAARYGSAAGWQLRMFDDIYGNRMGNRPGTRDGSAFIGRGGPQITGREGYAAIGDMIGVNLVDDPKKATLPELQPAIAAAFWTWKQMNGPADAGNFSGTNGVVHRWNGGFNGLAERKAALGRILPIARSLEKKDAPLPKPVPPPKNAPAAISEADFALDLLAAMRKQRADKVAVGPDVLTIFFVRGMGVDYKPNGNPFDNTFNDLCGLLRVTADGKASIIAKWPCTIDPGKWYVFHRINPHGAAAIKPGYYDGWIVGIHNGNHEALVQWGGPVTVYSDDNEDGSTVGDETRTGGFGINIHGPGTGYGDRLLTDIGRVSAGCLVVPSMPMQRERMRLIKTDARYLKNPGHVFGAFIFDAKDIVPQPRPLPKPSLPTKKPVETSLAAGGLVAAVAAWFGAHPGVTAAVAFVTVAAVAGAIYYWRNK